MNKFHCNSKPKYQFSGDQSKENINSKIRKKHRLNKIDLNSRRLTQLDKVK